MQRIFKIVLSLLISSLIYGWIVQKPMGMQSLIGNQKSLTKLQLSDSSTVITKEAIAAYKQSAEFLEWKKSLPSKSISGPNNFRFKKGRKVPSAEETAALNISRKLRRKLHTVTASNFEELYKPEFDKFLKEEASPNVYEALMRRIKKAARQNNITLRSDFGVRVKVARPDIVETAVAAGSFSTLVKAVTAAGLAETLKGGMFTVFAPSDEAFAKVDAAVLEGLLADKEKLTRVLLHHVVDGSTSSKKIGVLNGNTVTTMAGTTIPVKVGRQDNVITLDKAKVVTADIKCKNGIIHILDSVLMPPEA